jgi:phage I-like protein
MAAMKQPASLRCLPRVVTAVALATAGDGAAPGLPTRMRILKWGENPNSQGARVCVGSPLVAAMREDVYPFRQIALDYEHNTWPKSAAYKESNEPREVAAFLTVEAVEGQGVFVSVDRWTPSGLAKAHNFCDLSAVPLLDKDGNVTAIVSVALSRTGAVPDIVFEQAAAMSAGFTLNQTHQGASMDWKEMIAAALGMDKDAPDADVQKALAAFFDKAKGAKAAGDGAAALSAEAIGGIVATAVKAHTLALSARLDGQEKARLIEAARGEGKAVALADTLLDRMTVAEVQSHVDGLPIVVPLTALTPVTISEGRTVSLSATELQVCKALGLSAEAYAKEKAVAL